jgi:hypothetical protein
MGDWRDSFAALNEVTGAVCLMCGSWDLKARRLVPPLNQLLA